MFDYQYLLEQFERSLSWLESYAVSFNTSVQLLIIASGILVGALVRAKLRPKIQPAIERLEINFRTKMILNNIARLILQITAIFVILIGSRIAASDMAGNIDTRFSEAVMALLGAWILIRLGVQFIGNSVVRNIFALTIWIVASLSILGILDETTQTLDAIGMSFGDFRLSALTVVKGIIALFILLYSALFLSSFLERKIQSVTSLTVSSRVLIGKIVRVTLVTFALLIGVTSAGIDLSLFAVFSGALGLGVGFGLQKGISNLFSGMLLLMDKSIKPGDVIELPGTNGETAFGWVETMGARYTEIVTRDNKSFLIPNEDFITHQVVNWSHGSTLIRLEVKFGVHYDSDPHIVRDLAIEAARSPERVVDDPAPVCWLYEFGDSSLNFKLRFWIKDAEKGVTNVRGMVMMALWDTFKENSVQIPYPHREVYIHQANDTPPAKKKKPAAKSKAVEQSEKDSEKAPPSKKAG